MTDLPTAALRFRDSMTVEVGGMIRFDLILTGLDHGRIKWKFFDARSSLVPDIVFINQRGMEKPSLSGTIRTNDGDPSRVKVPIELIGLPDLVPEKERNITIVLHTETHRSPAPTISRPFGTPTTGNWQSFVFRLRTRLPPTSAI
ncbi:hypothetical protein [uncultured Jannaschia sp.]|uniref:hypothetical protein n=1 Tax=uncultured Jannaschia sp. TaxID=293347 RepID=UPI00262312A1|nr:hypothetical protein [uncultured Jannaschia sp.]